jgi:catechol 2,3-dioxygenase-like lactoylglutathione lyase family enzyme
MIALDDGFEEATAIVHDLDDSVARFCRLFGFSLIWEGDADPGALALMGLDPDTRAREALVGDPAQRRGNIRFFELPGQRHGVMRDGAQVWDSGGLFDINVRALRPAEEIHEEMTRSGFCAFGPLTAWDFGPMSVKEVVSRDADGLAIAVIERTAPPLEGFEYVTGPASYVFNSTQTVQDFDAARAFYVDALGWQVVQETDFVHESGDNCIGLPIDVARTRPIRVGIYQANGRNDGSVELLEYTAGSRDFSAVAVPPRRGWAALRFPMRDMEGFLARAGKGGCAIVPPCPVRIEPHGAAVAGAAITPWGVRLEVFRCEAWA